MGITVKNNETMDEMIPKNETQIPDFGQNSGDDSILFSEMSTECCVGIVDIVSSTKVTASLPHAMACRLYSTFLSTMTQIVKKHGGTVVKNGGDSLLYYFQGAPSNTKSMFARCLECSLSMIEARCGMNAKLAQEKIPSLSYRVSADYGKVTLANSSDLSYHDIFGSPVNFCSKINCRADPNTIVLGGDLYHATKELPGYSFHEVEGFSVGFKLKYPVYSVTRNAYQYKSIVETTIEKSLLSISKPTLDTISSRLFNQYNCLLSGCYEHPEYLKKVLSDIFGNSHSAILEDIRTNLGYHVHQKPIAEFLERLSG